MHPNDGVMGVPAYKAAIFLCPNCEEQLKEDPKTKKYDDIECDVCGRRTTNTLACRPCDYDLCFKCAAVRSDPEAARRLRQLSKY